MTSKKEKATREYLQTLTKDRVIELCLQYIFDAKVAEKQLDQANERLKKETEERQHLQCDYKTLLSHYNNLKESAIVPRFRIGQEIWYVGCSSIQSWIVNRIELDYMVNDKLCEIYRLGHYGTDDYSCCIMPFDSDRYFATEQEAQAKLKEIQGE